MRPRSFAGILHDRFYFYFYLFIYLFIFYDFPYVVRVKEFGFHSVVGGIFFTATSAISIHFEKESMAFDIFNIYATVII